MESVETSEGDISDKIVKYETFLNETLKKDLQKVLDQRDRVYTELSEYLQLKNVIEKIKESSVKEELKTRVDLGCNFYVQANVPDPSKVMVCIGFGFFLEMTLPEALAFIEKKAAILNQQSDVLTRDASKIKAHIRLVLEGLREIQHLENLPEIKPYRDLLA